MATIKFRESATHTRQTLPGCRTCLVPRPKWFPPIVSLFALAFAQGTTAAEPPDRLAQRVESTFNRAKENYQGNTNDAQVAWLFGRACFDLAALARKDTQREALAQQGIAACRRALELDSNSAPAHYYLAFNFGELAQTKLLGALKLVNEMEGEFLAAIELDPKLDHAGPHRSLGLLYRDAPGWPASIGSRAKSRFHLEKAVELAPDFPANRLVLLESLVKWGEDSKVRVQIEPTEACLQKAREELTGDRWALDWIGWEALWEKIKTDSKPVRLQSPRQKS